MGTYLRFSSYVYLLPWCVYMYVLGQEESCTGWRDHDRWLRPQTEGALTKYLIMPLIIMIYIVVVMQRPALLETVGEYTKIIPSMTSMSSLNHPMASDVTVL